ncbi:MAG: terminase large subunit domain-containing protein, partial [Sphingosinicella sp.]|uniref:terminase large subunit domain-containing protein n=1 Tax=Sphingosinicella sp. TaxID=1917971 RepID=UPI004037BFB0
MSEIEALRDLAKALGGRTAEEIAYVLARLTEPQLRSLFECWALWAHDGQLAPAGDWSEWLMMAGRGFGKTRAGAEWVSELARSHPGARIALIGGTPAEVERVMIQGESGLIAVARTGEEVGWHPSRGLVRFSGGAEAFVYSGANPDSLRGPQHHFAWCDELAKWAHPQATWDNLKLGLRLGTRPRALMTTTPRPIALLRRLVGAADTAISRGRTRDNLNLPDAVQAELNDLYGGTRFGRQELDGELIEEVEGALWTRAGNERDRARAPASCKRVVIGV